jgi:O-antigen/teichoic acid export membrane protein
MPQNSKPVITQDLQNSGGNVRKLFVNIISLLSSDTINRATSFVIYALVGRHLGAFAFGQMSLALTIFYTFQVFSLIGLKILIIREVAKDNSKIDQYLIHGSIIVIITTLLSYLLLIGFVNLMGYTTPPLIIDSFDNFIDMGLQAFGYNLPPSTALVIFLVCSSLIPFALATICEAVFQGLEKMVFIAYVNTPINILRIVIVIFLTTNSYGLIAIALTLLTTQVIAVVAQWVLMLRYITRPKIVFNVGFAYEMLRQAMTFFGIDAIIAISTSAHIVMLSVMLNETSVGLYSSAIQLVTPLIILYRSIVFAVFPIMCHHFDVNNPSSMKHIAENLIELLLMIAIPITAGVIIYGEWGLTFIYGDPKFARAENAVIVLVFVTLMQALTSVLGRVLIANMLEMVALRIVIINLILDVVFGAIFINQFGMIGAAMAAFLVMVINLLQHYIPVQRMFSGIPLWQLSWRSLIATGVMVTFIYVTYDLAELFTIFAAILVYLGVLAILMIVTVGNLQNIKAKYLGLQTIT